MNDRTRARIQKILIEQEKKRPSALKATTEYFRRWPDQLSVAGRNILAGTIVGNTRPKNVWMSQHSQNRMNGGSVATLTQKEIDEVIRSGVYMTNRELFFDSKHGVWKSNAGRIGPKTPGNKKQCPTRRLTTGDKTVVLSFCYPRGVRNLPMWYPVVVTAYRTGRKRSTHQQEV